MPNVPLSPAMRSSSSNALRSSRVEPLRIELAQHRKLMLARRLRHPGVIVEQQREPGIFLHLLAGDPGVERERLHAPRGLLEAEHCEIGDHAIRAARGEPAVLARAV